MYLVMKNKVEFSKRKMKVESMLRELALQSHYYETVCYVMCLRGGVRVRTTKVKLGYKSIEDAVGALPRSPLSGQCVPPPAAGSVGSSLSPSSDNFPGPVEATSPRNV